MEQTTDWRAVCEKSARTVRRGEQGKPMPCSYLYLLDGAARLKFGTARRAVPALENEDGVELENGAAAPVENQLQGWPPCCPIFAAQPPPIKNGRAVSSPPAKSPIDQKITQPPQRPTHKRKLELRAAPSRMIGRTICAPGQSSRKRDSAVSRMRAHTAMVRCRAGARPIPACS